MQSNFNDYFLNYKIHFESIINNNEEMKTEKLIQKKEKSYQLALKIFEIEDCNNDKELGVSEFKNKVHDCIKSICELKPGRKLIKGLSNGHLRIVINNCVDKAKVIEYENYLIVTPGKMDSKSYYYTYNKIVAEKPAWMNLAHELIHVLHYSNKTNLNYCKNKTNNILDGMDNLEEQYAITGFNYNYFKKKRSLDPPDVICENAFLLALNLPPRVNHRQGQQIELNSDSFPLNSQLNDYFGWLQKEWNLINQIPQDMTQKKQISRFISKYPMAAKSLTNELKNDLEFMLEIVLNNPKLLNKFSFLYKNKDFIKKTLMRCDRHDFSYLFNSLPVEFKQDSQFLQDIAINDKKNY